MKPRLIPEWKRVLKKAWSVKFMLLAAIFAGMDTLLPFFVDDMPQKLFAWISGFSVTAGLITRFLSQEEKP